MSYAEVYVAIKTLGMDHPFDYKIPPDLNELAKVGSVVTVPFGNRQESGYITRIKDNSLLSGKEIKSLSRIIYDVPVFDRDRLKLIYWMAAYYVAPVVKIMEFFLPPGKKGKKSLPPAGLEHPDMTIADTSTSTPNACMQPESGIRQSCRAFMSDITGNIGRDRFKGFLLKDFNDLQKLEIIRYLALQTKKTGGRTLILAPEITDIKSIYNGFDLKTSIAASLYYSEKSPSRRYEDWFDISRDKFDIIFGTRSAIFLSINQLDMIIIDEADDLSYKESTIVRYNLKDVALRLAKILKIPCVLFASSASVNLRYEFSKKSDMETIDNPDTSTGKNLFKKQIIDLKMLDRSKEDINITGSLFKGLKEETGKKNKAIIFVNRRGYSSFLICKKCGHIPKCDLCNIAYKYHSSQKKLICHHCCRTVDFTGICSSCGSDDFSYQGTGIEKIEYKLKQRFKDIAIFRIDSDKLKKKNELKEILTAINAAGPAILIGTQVIAKDMKIKDITLVAVIDFDSLFNLPDYSINEKACQILIRLSSVLKNNSEARFIIQAYNTDNFVLKSFMASDFNLFYEEEIKNRKELFYPPFSNLVNIIISGEDENLVKSDINRLFSMISNKINGDFLLLGPSPSPFYKLNQHYRWHILVKTPKIMQFAIFLGKILAGFKKSGRNKIITDIDPVWIL